MHARTSPASVSAKAKLALTPPISDRLLDPFARKPRCPLDHRSPCPYAAVSSIRLRLLFLPCMSPSKPLSLAPISKPSSHVPVIVYTAFCCSVHAPALVFHSPLVMLILLFTMRPTSWGQSPSTLAVCMASANDCLPSACLPIPRRATRKVQARAA